MKPRRSDHLGGLVRMCPQPRIVGLLPHLRKSNDHFLQRKEFAMTKGKTFPIGRNAGSGRFTTVRQAEKRPSTHVVERVPKAGHGDTKK